MARARRFVPTARDGKRFTFMEPTQSDPVRLQSRHVVPWALRPWLDDRRRLGVMVRRIRIRGGAWYRDMSMDDPGLVDGWWAVERDAGTIGRWTDGDAGLPFIDTAAVIEVLIGDTVPYAALPPESAETEQAPPRVLRAG